MSVIDEEYDFDDLRATAKQIDKGILNLEKKLSNMNNLGYLLAPEDTKKIALDVLKEYEDEVKGMKENCEHCYEEEAKMLNECKENNHKVTEYIDRMNKDLDKIENLLKINGHYVPYVESQISPVSLNNGMETPLEVSYEGNHLLGLANKSQESELSVINNIIENEEKIQEMTDETISCDKSLDVYSLISDYTHKDTFNLSNGSSSMTPSTSFKTSSKISEKSYEPLDTCSISNLSLSFRKRANTLEEACKTPTDPGISLVSMKLLGKSNIKTKVYKTIPYINSKAE